MVSPCRVSRRGPCRLIYLKRKQVVVLIMGIRTLHHNEEKTWFITFTCFKWISLFEITQSYDIVYHWLKMINGKYGIKTFAFVIMPNHVHLLLYLEKDGINLNQVISNGKRFMAYELVKRLEMENSSLITVLADSCSGKEKIKGQKHKIFEPSFDAKAILNLYFLNQKINYIHGNPVKGKWNLCNEYIEYVHSSAAFYENGIQHSSIQIVDYREYWT